MIHAKSLLALTSAGKAIVDKAFRDAQESGSTTVDLSAQAHSWTAGDDEKPIGWTYLGSANLTRAAHGNIGGSASNPSMSSSNWEL